MKEFGGSNMNVCGIVAEYNPFHNGHFFHLQESIRQTDCEYTICVLSGNFTQRGESALFDKWVRTKMALDAGADIIIELPILYVLQPAEWFAYGAVSILDALGVVTHISFGSEMQDIELLHYIANTLLDEPIEYKLALKQSLQSGCSFPSAQSEALLYYTQRYTVKLNDRLNDIRKIISMPNNILGIEYLKCLKRRNSPIIPVLISRIGASHHSKEIHEGIVSATAIRDFIYAHQLHPQLKENLPAFIFKIIADEITDQNGPVFIEDFERIIVALLRQHQIERISQLPDVAEGLEYRIKKAVEQKVKLKDILSMIKTKRYTYTRLQRIALYTLLNIDRDIIEWARQLDTPPYARILGFSHHSLPLLTQIKKTSRIPLITKMADAPFILDSNGNKMMYYDTLATDIYALAIKNPDKSKAKRDYTQKIILPF